MMGSFRSAHLQGLRPATFIHLSPELGFSSLIFGRSWSLYLVAMRERHLKLGVEDAIDAFTTIKWKFYEVSNLELRIEVPRSEGERFVVRIVYQEEEALKKAVARLQAAGFILQEIKFVAA